MDRVGAIVLCGILLGCDGGAWADPKAKVKPIEGTATGSTQLPKAAPVRLAANQKTRVVLLGTGTPIPDPRRAGPSLAVVVGAQAYLVDAGPGVVRRAAAAAEAGVEALAPVRLTHLFITHLHSDHTIGLPDVMLTPAVTGRREPLQLFGPSGLAAMVSHLKQAYAVDLRIRADVEGPSEGYRFVPSEVSPGPIYQDPAVRVTAFAVPHGRFEHALGFRFETADRVVVVSGDTGPSEAIVKACNGCDLLVHEVYCQAGLHRLAPHVREYHQGFHTSSHELATIAQRARPKTLLLTHLLPFGCSEAELLAELRDRYAGEVLLGEDLQVY